MKPHEVEKAQRLLRDLELIDRGIEQANDLQLIEIRFRPDALIDDCMKDAIIGAIRAEMQRRRMEAVQQLDALGVEIEEGGAA